MKKVDKIQMIKTNQDLYEMLDSFFPAEGDWWNEFYNDRNKPIPFFKNAPDENLVKYFEKGLIQPENILELGCGPGRNARFFEKVGCRGDAIDISKAAIEWAQERLGKNSKINLHYSSIFKYKLNPRSYDFVYDAGCFHHIFPHRRMQYLDLVKNALKSAGKFGLVCFKKEHGSGLTDKQVYEIWNTKGGLGYTKEELTDFFGKDFKFLEFREMEDASKESNVFGLPLFWVILMQKTGT